MLSVSAFVFSIVIEAPEVCAIILESSEKGRKRTQEYT